MSVVVISQPMFFPWVGLFEQVALADVFVHYDNVQLPQGRSFMTRVQIKTSSGVQWLSAPVKRIKGQLLQNVELDNTADWRRKHLATLEQAYARAPHRDTMLGLVASIYERNDTLLCGMNNALIERIAKYLGIETRFALASDSPSDSMGTLKLLELCQRFEAKTYITGHGALNYLDHDAFEAAGVGVSYMDYRCVEYDQLHGPFTPYVSILDAIANLGPDARRLLQPRTRDWKEMLHERA